MNNFKYSILTFIVGKGYEKVHEILNKQDDVEYVLVTDDKDLKSNTWNVVYDENLLKFNSPFERCFNIRYNAFRYCSTDICITIDGSMQVTGSLDNLVNEFNAGNYDICLMPHPLWASMIKEYHAWVNLRNYGFNKARKMLNLMVAFGYDVNADNGLFQLCFSIKRRNSLTQKIDDVVLALLKMVSGKDGFERLDQTWYSFVLNTQFNNLKVLPVSEQITGSKALQWYWHGGNMPKELKFAYDKPDIKKVFGKYVECKYIR